MVLETGRELVLGIGLAMKWRICFHVGHHVTVSCWQYKSMRRKSAEWNYVGRDWKKKKGKRY